LRYTITGNFQYDLGLYGLKKLLDFFEEDYRSGEFYIETDKKPEEILELVILKQIADRGSGFFLLKILNELKIDSKKLKEETISIDIDLHSLVKEQKSLDSVINRIGDEIFSKLTQKFPEHADSINSEVIKEIIWNKSVELLNSILHNFQADKKARGKLAFDKAIQKLYKDMNEEYSCSFCGKKPARRISRDTFFFAPAQLNAFWFNEASIFICSHCLASNLAVTQALSFMDRKTAVAVYVPNLHDMEVLNEGLQVQDLVQLTLKVIARYILKYEAAIRDLQVIEFYLDSQEPKMEFYILTEETIKNLIRIHDELGKLQEKYHNILIGEIKDRKGHRRVNLLEETLKCIFQNQNLFYFVHRFAKLSFMAESFRQNRMRKPPLKGFYPLGLLKILNLHFKLSGGLRMVNFEAFKEYGQNLSRKIYSQLKERGGFDPNTYNNKKISLANAFLNASKGDLRQFMETLTRVIITYNAPINNELLSMINENTYREISTLIALSIMAELPAKNSSKNKENQAESVL